MNFSCSGTWGERWFPFPIFLTTWPNSWVAIQSNLNSQPNGGASSVCCCWTQMKVVRNNNLSWIWASYWLTGLCRHFCNNPLPILLSKILFLSNINSFTISHINEDEERGYIFVKIIHCFWNWSGKNFSKSLCFCSSDNYLQTIFWACAERIHARATHKIQPVRLEQQSQSASKSFS